MSTYEAQTLKFPFKLHMDLIISNVFSLCSAPALKAGSADFKLLDTDKDNNITSNDDPYLPYYPGTAFCAIHTEP